MDSPHPHWDHFQLSKVWREREPFAILSKLCNEACDETISDLPDTPILILRIYNTVIYTINWNSWMENWKLFCLINHQLNLVFFVLDCKVFGICTVMYYRCFVLIYQLGKCRLFRISYHGVALLCLFVNESAPDLNGSIFFDILLQ